MTGNTNEAEYKCVSCGHTVRTTDLASVRCPKCGYKGLELTNSPESESLALATSDSFSIPGLREQINKDLLMAGVPKLHRGDITGYIMQLIAVHDKVTLARGFDIGIEGQKSSQNVLLDKVEGLIPKGNLKGLEDMPHPEFYDYTDKPKHSDYDLDLAESLLLDELRAEIAKLRKGEA